MGPWLEYLKVEEEVIDGMESLMNFVVESMFCLIGSSVFSEEKDPISFQVNHHLSWPSPPHPRRLKHYL